ncbi:MAG: hypothetical protein ACW99Q_15005 [Candidatus Kariarchaeaceae archaeon]
MDISRSGQAHSDWIKITALGDLFNDGQRIVFASQPLPAGWNLVTSSDGTTLNDKMIMMTNSQSEVGDIGGSWFISGMVANSKHKHFTPSQMGNPTTTLVRGTSELFYFAAFRNHKHTLNNTGNHTHTFDGTWRPLNVTYIMGEFTT